MPIIAKQERISHMTELKDRKVAQHNDLITSVAKMDKIPLKIFELAVSCIDTENPPKDNVIYISKKELFSFFDVSDSNKHSRFKDSVEKMQEQAFFEVREEGKKGFKFRRILPIPTVGWNDFDDEVFIRFNPDIMPYLIELKTNFTQYALTDIMDLESKYSIILYKWLSMNYNQFETYSFKGNRSHKQLDSYRNPKLSLTELRTMSDTEDTYKDNRDLIRYIVDNAKEEINKFTHLNISYEKIRKGRSISEIQFHIEKKAHWKDEEYKRDDESAQVSIEIKEKTRLEYYASGMSSTYTSQLLTATLITAIDMMNQETIISLSKNVYPLYEELVNLYGQNALTEHLGYVSDSMVGYTGNKKNISKYLQISAKQYLENGVGTLVEENKKQRAKTSSKKIVKKAPEWSNENYVEKTTDEEKERFAEWQKKMRENK